MNIVYYNSAFYLRTIKQYISLQGIGENEVLYVNDPKVIGEELLFDSFNIYIFDYTLDLLLLEELRKDIAEFKDAVLSITVFVKSSEIGKAYTMLTNNIFILPQAHDIMMYLWQSPIFSLSNVLLAESINKSVFEVDNFTEVDPENELIEFHTTIEEIDNDTEFASILLLKLDKTVIEDEVGERLSLAYAEEYGEKFKHIEDQKGLLFSELGEQKIQLEIYKSKIETLQQSLDEKETLLTSKLEEQRLSYEDKIGDLTLTYTTTIDELKFKIESLEKSLAELSTIAIEQEEINDTEESIDTVEELLNNDLDSDAIEVPQDELSNTTVQQEELSNTTEELSNTEEILDTKQSKSTSKKLSVLDRLRAIKQTKFKGVQTAIIDEQLESDNIFNSNNIVEKQSVSDFIVEEQSVSDNTINSELIIDEQSEVEVLTNNTDDIDILIDVKNTIEEESSVEESDTEDAIINYEEFEEGKNYDEVVVQHKFITENTVLDGDVEVNVKDVANSANVEDAIVNKPTEITGGSSFNEEDLQKVHESTIVDIQNNYDSAKEIKDNSEDNLSLEKEIKVQPIVIKPKQIHKEVTPKKEYTVGIKTVEEHSDSSTVKKSGLSRLKNKRFIQYTSEEDYFTQLFNSNASRLSDLKQAVLFFKDEQYNGNSSILLADVLHSKKMISDDELIIYYRNYLGLPAITYDEMLQMEVIFNDIWSKDECLELGVLQVVNTFNPKYKAVVLCKRSLNLQRTIESAYSSVKFYRTLDNYIETFIRSEC